MRAGPLSVLLLRLGLVAAVYTLVRVAFVWHNAALFTDVPAAAYLGGIRFDLFAIAWLHLPWVVLVLIAPRPTGWMARIQYGLFLLVNAMALAFNAADVGYYAFTLKRSTADLLGIIGGGGDLAGLMPVFLRDYWFLVVGYIACVLFLAWGYRAAGRMDQGGPIGRPWQAGWRMIATALLVLASRGGTQLIPLQPLDAARYGGPANLAVVLNTPYTMLMSFGKPTLVERNYMTREDADLLWPIVHHYPRIPPPPDLPGRDSAVTTFDRSEKPNVVIIILESFSAAYSGVLSGGESSMPFLDSLMGQGLNCTRAYANGRRSIDGVPAILASMPQLMDEAFITSPYASLPFTSLAHVLAAEGYRTSFFHGGRNGTMGFDGFARSAGFQRYVGMNEYPNGDVDFDEHWGIRDRPFLQYWARELAREQQPFLSTVFTLSSHHPYDLPPEEAVRFGGGQQEIQPTLRYTDDALRQFFNTAGTMPWYANTLFVITADHTADLERTGIHGGLPIDYWVPLLYFSPKNAPAWPKRWNGTWEGVSAETDDHVTQHIDILPTTLYLIGHDKPYFSFGQNVFMPVSPRCAIWHANGIYHITNAHMQLQFDGEQVIGRTMITAEDALTQEERNLMEAILERRLKAAIQQFNRSLLDGRLVFKPDVP